MREDLRRTITTAATYELIGERNQAAEVISRIVEQTERDGVPGLLRYRFYLHPTEPRAGSLITYADDETFVRHHEMVTKAPVFAGLKDAIVLQSYELMGSLGAARGWLDEHAPALLQGAVGDHAAGFVRDAPLDVAESTVQTMTYDLTVPPDEFVAAAQANAQRVRAEGLPGVWRYHFFVDARQRASGIVVYDCAQTFVDHHVAVADWDEFKRFKACLKLDALRLFGDATPALPTLEKIGRTDAVVGPWCAGFAR